MTWLLVAGAWWIGGAVAAWLLRRRPDVATGLAVSATVIGSACLFAAALFGLSGIRVITRFSWSLPFGDAALATFHLPRDTALGRRTLVLRRTGAGWKIVHLHASLL